MGRDLCVLPLSTFFLPFVVFIYLAHWVLVVTCRILSCGTRTLSCSRQDLSPDQGLTSNPRIGSAES